MAGPGLPGHAEGVGFGCERLGGQGQVLSTEDPRVGGPNDVTDWSPVPGWRWVGAW